MLRLDMRSAGAITPAFCQRAIRQNPLARLVATKRVVNIDDLMAEQVYIERDPRFVSLARAAGRLAHHAWCAAAARKAFPLVH